MEKVQALEKKKLINELTQGREFVNQLKKQIGPLASPEECDLLLGKILSSLEKSLSILNLKALLLEGGNANSTSSCSSISFLGNNISPKSEVLDSTKDQMVGKNVFTKKRKTPHQWSKQVSICGTGLESPHDDGYSWRKYGQKDILGSIHPRAYYRCTHRNTQGCLATKQVQRSVGNSSIFEVTYKGRHSCKIAQSEIFSLENQKRQKHNKKQELVYQRQEQEMVIFNSGPNHKVENFSLTKEEVFTPFSFSPTPLNPIEETQYFSNSMTPFSLPITSELPTYMSLLTDHNEQFAMENILQSSDSDVTELISTPTSISNSPFGGDWDFSMDFEPSTVTFDIEEFFK
ncbi:PREDICTED: probable WRKY transcription factor 41 [Nicotiana attenuata]|uniref:Wrky transcription factor 41 n=1 Tax=Nicotiana attenuata TaxID=49451 RepID=A0A314KJ53_NICAT|nr:PREDICTED: probable WRKY transcription factor 41 [Nicotiana attenuata]OIT29406.1 putative wrky transcription factor 41 [Nicotiana attenuata]